MTNSRPNSLVSVIIPAFNAAAYLAESIRSVLSQDFPHIEIIVIDDGSTDSTLSVARQFGDVVRTVAGPHLGLAAARNRGIAISQGDLLLHLDADDLLTEGSITARVKALGSAFDIITGRLECFFSPDVREDVERRFILPEHTVHGHLPGTSIVRAASFRQFGLLDESFSVNADLDWWVRARDLGARIGTVDEVVVRRRIHGRNMSTLRHSEFAASQLRIIKSSLERKRGDGRKFESTYRDLAD